MKTNITLVTGKQDTTVFYTWIFFSQDNISIKIALEDVAYIYII